SSRFNRYYIRGDIHAPPGKTKVEAAGAAGALTAPARRTTLVVPPPETTHEGILEGCVGSAGAARRVLSGHDRTATRRADQRAVDRGRGRIDLPGCIPLLRPVHRRPGHGTGSHPGHAR